MHVRTRVHALLLFSLLYGVANIGGRLFAHALYTRAAMLLFEGAYLPTLPGIPGFDSPLPRDSPQNPGNLHAVVCANFLPQISAQRIAVLAQF